MRKLIFLSIILSLLILTGCDLLEKKVTLNLFHYKNDITSQLGQLTESFHKKYPKITIEIEYIPYVEPYFLLQRFKDKTKVPDIMMIQPYGVLSDFARDGYLYGISKEKYNDRFFDSTKKCVSYNGNIYGIPFNLDGLGIFYNRRIFQKYNLSIPTTFSDLKQLSSVLKKNNIIPFAVSIKDSWTLGYLFLMAYSATLGYNDQSMQDLVSRMNAGNGSLGNKNINSMFQTFDFYKQNGGHNAVNMGWNDQTNNFSNQKCAMMVQSLYSYSAAKSKNPELDAGFIPFPFSDNVSDTKIYADAETVFAISAQAGKDKIKAANKFFDYLTGLEGKKIIVSQLHLVPALKDADVTSLDTPYRDLYKYFADNKVTMQSYRIWNPDVFEYSKQQMLDYYYGKINSQKLIKSLDDKWKSTIKK